MNDNPNIPDPEDGPERDPPLAHTVDQLIHEQHMVQPVTAEELLNVVQSQLYRLRGVFKFGALVLIIKDMLSHNEYHISNGEWMLTAPDGERIPLVTPEMVENDPAAAEIANTLMRLAQNSDEFDMRELEA